MRAIKVVDYDPEWPRLYTNLRRELEPLLADLAPVFHHVGSTSVPGLAAKPKIDMHAAFEDLCVLPSAIQRVKQIVAYTFHGDPYDDLKWTFTSNRGSYGVRLYLCGADNIALRDRLAFRDYLKTHPARAAAYAELKFHLMDKAHGDWNDYTDGKTEFVLETLRLASDKLDYRT